jgi:cell division protein FtsW (lipid II flippase)
LRLIATVIVGVFSVTALLIWILWRACKSAERAEREPKYLRRILVLAGVPYVIAAVSIVAEVATGDMPVWMLLGLPIPILFAWFWLRQANRVKVPHS